MKSLFIFIETYGCSANSSDSQIMAGLLSRAGHEIVKDIEKADVIIVNTCSVKATTVNKIIYRIKEIRKKFPEKHIIAAGCLPFTESRALSEIDNLHMTGPYNIKSIPSDVSAISEGERICRIEKNREEKLCLPKIRENSVIDIVQICSGCASACTFCATRLARGSIFSYPLGKIIAEIESSKKFGSKEFWITGQDVSAYGLDEGGASKLPSLIETITENIPGKYFLRIGMLNPAHVSKMSNELLKAYRSENVFKFLHLPVQSGSDAVLKKMNRNHSVSDFVDIVEKFRRHYPKINIWTDIIVGFPGETDADFDSTVKIIEKTRPDFINISQFSCHRDTPAAKMKQISSEKKKERSRIMTEIASRIAQENNKKWVGWEGEALIDEFKSEKRNWIARNFSYKPIVIKTNDKQTLGKLVSVKITESSETCLFGEII